MGCAHPLRSFRLPFGSPNQFPSRCRGRVLTPLNVSIVWLAMHLTWCMAERVGFEPTSRDHREPLFESGALSQLGNLSKSRQLIYQWFSSHPTGTNHFDSCQRVGCAHSLRSFRLPSVAEPTSRDHRESRFRRDALSQLGNLSFHNN